MQEILQSPKDADKLSGGEIVVTDITSPDWDPVLKKASAIVTNKGGRTSHASIVARELGVPAIVGLWKCNGKNKGRKQYNCLLLLKEKQVLFIIGN